MKPVTRRLLLIPLLASLVFLASLYLPFPGHKLDPAPVLSLSLVDRNNVPLREVLSDEGGRCRWLELNEISPHLLKATITAEDRHFFRHPGVNIFALARAFWQNVTRGRVISGASTISQQLVRNIYRSPRTLPAKVLEAWMALRLEKSLRKNEILAQYLNRISYGNQAFGIAAASRLYFDKPARDLSLAEAAFLASLPRSPSNLNPYRAFAAAKSRQEIILSRMKELGIISEEARARAAAEPLKVLSEKDTFRAPHFCDLILARFTPEERRRLSLIQTTLDYGLQRKIEILVRNHVRALRSKEITNAAVVVLNNADGALLALVGSRDFFDTANNGQVNGAVALRQPGSTLKPFTYGLALESGMTPAAILEDRDIQFSTPEGSYRPRNYDKKFHGPVRLRQALACSYNVPAVVLTQQMGPDRLFQKLKSLGFESLKKSPSHYGLGLTLGNGEVTLLELARSYAALARNGLYFPEKCIVRVWDSDQKEAFIPDPRSAEHVFSSRISAILTNILSDNDARVPSFGYISPLHLPFPCASKTGTTKDFKDNWTIGFTPRHTVGVWVGNFDGTPMQNVSGITGAGPLFKDIMLLIEKSGSSEPFIAPDDLEKIQICPLSGQLATPRCPGAMEEIFIPGTEPREHCELHSQPGDPIPGSASRTDRLIISFPVNGDVFKMDPVLRPQFQTIKFSAEVPRRLDIRTLEWRIDGEPVGECGPPFSWFWHLKPGFYTITAVAKSAGEENESPPVRIRVLS